MPIDFNSLKAQGFLPQKQEGRYSVRLKVVGGRLGAGQLKAIAAAADAFGEGHVHLTSRQAVEIPGVKRGDLEKLQELLAAAGTENVQLGPKARTVTACQGLDVCKWGCVSTYSLAVELTGRYYGRPLPAKFKIGVTGCRNNCLKIEENDVGIKGAMLVELERGLCQGCGACVKACRARALAAPGDGEAPAIDRAKCLSCGRCVKVCPDGAWTGRPAYEVYFGGNFGNGSSVGRALLPLVESREALVKAIDAAVDFYQANGKPGQRFRAVAEQAGWDSLAKAAASAAGL